MAQSWFILIRLWQVSVTFLAFQKGSDQLLSHRLDRTSHASQVVGLKKVQIAELSPSQIMLDRMIYPNKMSKCYNSLSVRAWTNKSKLYLNGHA